MTALGEDRTHDLQMARTYVIMRLTRCLLRYEGTKNAHVLGKKCENSAKNLLKVKRPLMWQPICIRGSMA